MYVSVRQTLLHSYNCRDDNNYHSRCDVLKLLAAVVNPSEMTNRIIQFLPPEFTLIHDSRRAWTFHLRRSATYIKPSKFFINLICYLLLIVVAGIVAIDCGVGSHSLACLLLLTIIFIKRTYGGLMCQWKRLRLCGMYCCATDKFGVGWR